MFYVENHFVMIFVRDTRETLAEYQIQMRSMSEWDARDDWYFARNIALIDFRDKVGKDNLKNIDYCADSMIVESVTIQPYNFNQDIHGTKIVSSNIVKKF